MLVLCFILCPKGIFPLSWSFILCSWPYYCWTDMYWAIYPSVNLVILSLRDSKHSAWLIKNRLTGTLITISCFSVCLSSWCQHGTFSINVFFEISGEPQSKVHGSIINGVFAGKIVTPKGNYYVERSDFYFNDPQSFHSVIYHEKDIDPDPHRWGQVLQFLYFIELLYVTF